MGLIPEIKKLRDEIAPNTLLTINGDIPDRATGLKLVEQYGVDGVMIGRGVFTNPFAFEKESKEHSVSDYINLLLLHFDLHDKYSDRTRTASIQTPCSIFQNLYSWI